MLEARQAGLFGRDPRASGGEELGDVALGVGDEQQTTPCRPGDGCPASTPLAGPLCLRIVVSKSDHAMTTLTAHEITMSNDQTPGVA